MVVLVALDQLRPFIRRRVEGVVDSVLVSRRARACGAVSGDVRSDAHFSTPTQRHPGEYAACDTSLGNAHHIGCARRAHGITGVAYLLSIRIGGPSFRLALFTGQPY